MKSMFNRILLVGALIGSLTVTAPVTSAALPPPTVESIPVEVTANSTNLLFYFYGMLDAMDVADSGLLATSFRNVANSNRVIAATIRIDSPVMFSYLMGRAAQFDREADLRGEPTL
jgi:hypothetical protein